MHYGRGTPPFYLGAFQALEDKSGIRREAGVPVFENGCRMGRVTRSGRAGWWQGGRSGLVHARGIDQRLDRVGNRSEVRHRGGVTARAGTSIRARLDDIVPVLREAGLPTPRGVRMENSRPCENDRRWRREVRRTLLSCGGPTDRSGSR